MKRKSIPGTIIMKNESILQIIMTIAVLQGMSLMSLYAQSYPPSGFALPDSKSICITYEVEVNSNACTAGSIAPDNISNQSNVTGSNFAVAHTHDLTPAIPDSTLTPFAGIQLGNLVYLDENSNGIFDGMDSGINGVLLNVYHDLNDDGMLDVGDPKIGSTTTSNIGGMDGMYYFNLCPGKYIVEADTINFIMGGALFNNVTMVSTIASGAAADPDDHMDNVNHGAPVSGFGVASSSIALTYLGGPGNMDEYNTLDFGFRNPTSITIDDPMVMEGDAGDMNMLVFTITRSDNEGSYDIDIGLTGGTATSGVDFTVPSTTSVSFMSGGSLTATFEVEIIGDGLVELDETILVTISNPPSDVVIGKAIGTGTIQNDDMAEISVGNVSDLETNGPFIFSVTINNPVDVDVSVLFSTSDGTATTMDNDYTAVSMHLVTFLSGSTTAQTVIVPVIDDNKVELDETFSVNLSDLVSMGRSVSIMNAMGTGTIQNDDIAEISVGNVSDLEANGPFVFDVTITNPVDVDVTVLFSTSDGTATTLDNDYTAVSMQMVTFPAGSTMAQTVNVPVINDNKVELDETFSVNLSDLVSMGRSVSIMNAMGTGTIQNDDIAEISVGNVSDSEANGPFVFEVTITNPVDVDVTVLFSTSDGTATTLDNDYTAVSMQMVTFPAGSTMAQTVNVPVINDNKVELDETFTVTLSDLVAMGRSVTIMNAMGTGTIQNDDMAEISVGNVSDLEANGPFVFEVTMTHPVDVDVTLLFSTTDGTATTLDNDYTAVSMQLVTFPAGSTMAQTVNVPVIHDNKVELDETFTVTISDLVAMGRSVTIMNAMGTGTIQNEDMAGISVSDVSDLEANGPFTFEISLSHPVDVEVTMDFSTSDGTAMVSDNDYGAVTAQQVIFAEESTTSQMVVVTVNDDSKVELDEVFNVMLSNLTASGRAVTFSKGSGTGTIENDDIATIGIDSIAMAEGNSGDMTDFIFTIILDGEVDAVVSLNYTTMDSTATVADMDYDMNSGMLMFSANGGSMQMQTITVNVIGDDVSEGEEFFKVMLSDLMTMGRNVQFLNTIGLGTILDDDCQLPDIPVLSPSDTIVCPLDVVEIRVVSGMLNQAEEWVLYKGSCGGEEVERNMDGIFLVHSLEVTQYFVRGEGGCVTEDAACASVTITPAQYADASFDDSVCCPFTIAVFVDGNATGNNDGTDWNHAFQDLSDALLATSVCTGLADEIWVAEGVYYPDRILGMETSDRRASFLLRSGIRIFGGFPSGGDPGMEDRNPSSFQSILCGDIGNSPDKSDNSFHVVTGFNLSDQTLMDGFVIRNGMADGDSYDAHGAGIFLSSEGVAGVNQPAFKNIVLVNNMASGNGGAMYSLANSTGSPLVENSSFVGNMAMLNGGGFYNAALSVQAVASPIFRNVHFLNNTAGGDGGGLYSEAAGEESLASILMVNTLMAKNTATRGGAISQMSSGDNAVTNLKLVNNTIADNIVSDEGGAIYHFSASNATSSSVEIVNSIIYNNMASEGTTLYQEGMNTTTEVSYSIIHATDCFDMMSLAVMSGSIICDDMSILYNANPGFIDPDNNNYRINNGSIAINSGNNAEPDIHDPDLGGNVRIFGPDIDLGAYETQVRVRVIPAMSEWGICILILMFVIIARIKMNFLYQGTH